MLFELMSRTLVMRFDCDWWRSGSAPAGHAHRPTTSGDFWLRHLWRFTDAARLPGDGHVVTTQQAAIRQSATRACQSCMLWHNIFASLLHKLC